MLIEVLAEIIGESAYFQNRRTMVSTTNIRRLKKEGTSMSHQSIYNIIHADATGTLVQHTRHKLKYRRRPKHKHFLIADRISIH